MLFTNRMIHAPDLGLHTGGYLLSHTKFRIALEVARELISDAGVFARAFSQASPASSRNVLFLPLCGIARIRRLGHEAILRRGEFLMEEKQRGYLPRYEYAVVLIVEWEAGFLATRPFAPGSTGRISRSGLHRLRRIVGSLPLVGHGDQAASQMAASILSVLRAEGLPFDLASAGDLDEPTDSWVNQLNRAVDDAIQGVGRGPAIQDLQRTLGWSPRTIQRRLHEKHLRYGLHSSGWRDLLLRSRLAYGTNLLSAPGATTELVSATLGYGSPHALRKAMIEAGLPAPGQIPALIRQLG